MTADSNQARMAARAAPERTLWTTAGWATLAAVAAGWLGGLALLLRQRIVITNDSVSNYAHVWYVSERLWHGHGVPLRMPVIGHGAAFAFPYAALPWLSAALLRPLLGDWVVTLWLVLGCAGLLAAQLWALPELRRPWLAAAVLADPALVSAALQGELPFIWAAALLFGAVGCWRRGRRWTATLLLALAQATHPAVVLPLAGLLVLAWLRYERDRRGLLGRYALAVALTLPAVWLVLASPVVSDTSRSVQLSNFVGTLSERLPVVALPFLLLTLRRARAAWLAGAVALLLVANIAALDALGTRYSWGALRRAPDTRLLAFLDSPAFAPGTTYRLLDARDAKLGMYQLIQHGGRLDSEFFPESIDRRSWDTPLAYSAFLRARHVQYVVIYEQYADYHTNEHKLLDALATMPAACGAADARVQLTQRTPVYDVYAIDQGCATRAP